MAPRSRRPSGPQRVVTLTPALAEQVCALGLGRRLVGVSIRSEHPPSAARNFCVGSLHAPDIKKILSRRPDLVLAAQEMNRPETLAELCVRGLRVFVFPAYSTCEQILEGFQMLGRMLGREARARKLAARAQRELRRRRGGRRLRVFLQVWTDPLMGPARESYLHDLVECCGGTNVLGGRAGRIVTCSEKEIARANPDVILITLRKSAPEIRRWESYSRLSAARQGRIHAIPAYWVTPSPVALAGGAGQLRRLL